jgi:hypothetical protein
LPGRQVAYLAYTGCLDLEESKPTIRRASYDVDPIPALVLDGKDIGVFVVLQELLCDALS